MRTQRNWGWYLTLLRTPWLCVKVLKFNKGAMLSLQRHYFRNEVWFFLKGYGAVYLDGKWFNRQAPCMYMVNRQQLHRYQAGVNTWILEFQFGSRCKEEDIERV